MKRSSQRWLNEICRRGGKERRHYRNKIWDHREKGNSWGNLSTTVWRKYRQKNARQSSATQSLCTNLSSRQWVHQLVYRDLYWFLQHGKSLQRSLSFSSNIFNCGGSEGNFGIWYNFMLLHFFHNSLLVFRLNTELTFSDQWSDSLHNNHCF